MMDKILTFFNHLSAMVLGPCLLLMKYLLIQVFVGLCYAGAAGALIITSPVLLSVFLYKLGTNTLLAMVLGVLLSPVALIASIIIVPIASLAGVCIAWGDAIKVFTQGFTAGLFQGWNGISSQFNKPITYFATASLLFFAVFLNSRDNRNNNTNPTLKMSDLKQENVDFDFSPLQTEALEKQMNEAKKSIAPGEVKRAKALLDYHEQIQQLESEITRYDELLKNLSLVNNALTANVTPSLNDEIISMTELERPVLLVKEYNVGNNQWCVVPGSTKITNYHSVERLLKDSSPHPLTRDSFIAPTAYKGMTCHYAYYSVSVKCKELAETASRINELSKSIQTLANGLNVPNQMNADVTLFSSNNANTLFSSQKNIRNGTDDQLVFPDEPNTTPAPG